MDDENRLSYLGKEKTSDNPETHIYFKPTDPLLYQGN